MLINNNGQLLMQAHMSQHPLHFRSIKMLHSGSLALLLLAVHVLGGTAYMYVDYKSASFPGAHRASVSL